MARPSTIPRDGPKAQSLGKRAHILVDLAALESDEGLARLGRERDQKNRTVLGSVETFGVCFR